jgi:hypothetical protein
VVQSRLVARRSEAGLLAGAATVEHLERYFHLAGQGFAASRADLIQVSLRRIDRPRA